MSKCRDCKTLLVVPSWKTCDKCSRPKEVRKIVARVEKELTHYEPKPAFLYSFLRNWRTCIALVDQYEHVIEHVEIPEDIPYTALAKELASMYDVEYVPIESTKIRLAPLLYEYNGK